MQIKGPDGRIVTKPRTAAIKPGWSELVAEVVPPEPAAVEPVGLPVVEETGDGAKD